MDWKQQCNVLYGGTKEILFKDKLCVQWCRSSFGLFQVITAIYVCISWTFLHAVWSHLDFNYILSILFSTFAWRSQSPTWTCYVCQIWNKILRLVSHCVTYMYVHVGQPFVPLNTVMCQSCWPLENCLEGDLRPVVASDIVYSSNMYSLCGLCNG